MEAGSNCSDILQFCFNPWVHRRCETACHSSRAHDAANIHNRDLRAQKRQEFYEQNMPLLLAVDGCRFTEQHALLFPLCEPLPDCTRRCVNDFEDTDLSTWQSCAEQCAAGCMVGENDEKTSWKLQDEMFFDVPAVKHVFQVATEGGVVHVGAYTCNECEIYSQCDISSRVLLVEPNPRVYTMLRSKFGSTHTVINAAACEYDGWAELNIRTNDWGSSLLPLQDELEQVTTRAGYIDKTEGKERVPCRRLDTIVAEVGGSFSVLVIDAEGYELNVLKGAEKMLERIQMIHAEVYFRPQWQGGTTVEDLQEFLALRGFVLIGQTVSKRGMDGEPIFGDGIWLRAFDPSAVS